MAKPKTDGGTTGGVLATKLHLPPSPPVGLVSRSRLSDRLAEAPAEGVISVCARAGSGKTVLLADWCRAQRRPVAWLSLDATDTDPIRFWRHCTTALDRLRPGISERLAPFVDASSFDEMVTELVNELAADPDEGVLVLDDYHLIDAEVVHASMRLLLDHRPPGLTIVLVSRADPPLPLARLRASGLLTEIRTADLRFTDDEAAGLLDLTVDADLDAEVIAALVARTEGWAAGLQMAGLSLRGRADVDGFVAAFSGSHRHVLDYLTEEVLDCQPEARRLFLLETSVLERLSGPLCDAVTGRTDSQQMLEAIEQDGLFLSPLDEVHGWWRYHQLFADLLQIRLQDHGPERLDELHRNAAAWHAAHGSADDAIRHALAAGDPAWAAELLERHAYELFMRRRDARVRHWVAALPPELVDTRPRLLLGQARVALHNGGLAQVDGLIDAAERAHAATPSAPLGDASYGGLANIPAAIASLRAIRRLLGGEAEQARRLASQALAELGDEADAAAATAARSHLVGADWLEGRLSQAARRLETHLARLQAQGHHAHEAWASVYLGLLHRDQGDLDAAWAMHRQAIELARRPDHRTSSAAGHAHVGRADIAHQRDDLATALAEVDAGVELCRQFAFSRSLATALATRARILQATGDASGATQAMEEAAALSDPDVVDLHNPVPSERARLALDQGDPTVAARWIEERGLTTEDEPRYSRERAHLVLTRLALVQDRPAEALGLLHRLLQHADEQDRIASCIEIQTQRALALDALGEGSDALAALGDALAKAQPAGHVRVFVDEGPVMAQLIGRFVAAQDRETTTVDLSFLARLLRAFESDDPDAASVPVTSTVVGLVTQLTEREVEVLRMLAAGRRNQQIADELYVAVSTVKSHVTHIFDKLGATNRTEATARARDLGLID